MAYVEINYRGFTPTADEGFTVQWLRDGPISGATNYYYSGEPQDLGKTIKVRVSGYGRSITSDGIQIPHDQLQLEPSNIDLRGTTWKANEDVIYYSTQYKIEYTLKFDNSFAWTIDIIAKQLVEGEWIDSPPIGSGGTYKTYKIDGNDVVFLTDIDGDPELTGGVITDDNKIVFSGVVMDGGDLVFEKQ